jgi:hypothetical protein
MSGSIKNKVVTKSQARSDMGTDGPTDDAMDGPTDQPTNIVSYRGAILRLKNSRVIYNRVCLTVAIAQIQSQSPTSLLDLAVSTSFMMFF